MQSQNRPAAAVVVRSSCFFFLWLCWGCLFLLVVVVMVVDGCVFLPSVLSCSKRVWDPKRSLCWERPNIQPSQYYLFLVLLRFREGWIFSQYHNDRAVTLVASRQYTELWKAVIRPPRDHYEIKAQIRKICGQWPVGFSDTVPWQKIGLPGSGTPSFQHRVRFSV